MIEAIQEEIVRRCKAEALEAIEHCRNTGETDLRSVRGLVDAAIDSVLTGKEWKNDVD